MLSDFEGLWINDKPHRYVSESIAHMLNVNHVRPESGAPMLVSAEGVKIVWDREAQKWVPGNV